MESLLALGNDAMKSGGEFYRNLAVKSAIQNPEQAPHEVGLSEIMNVMLAMEQAQAKGCLSGRRREYVRVGLTKTSLFSTLPERQPSPCARTPFGESKVLQSSGSR